MDPDEVLRAIEDRFLKRKLTPAERIVLGQTWNKQTYDQMAQHSGYGDAHLKDTGYKLWRAISQALGQRVTKKSLLFVLREHLELPSLTSAPTVAVEERSAQTILRPVSPPQYPSGPLSPDSPLYINRPPNEDLAHSEIQRSGGFLRIKAPQKMGKTSLVFRLIQAAHHQNYKTANLDLQSIDKAAFKSTEVFLEWFCLRVSQELKLPPKLHEYWDSSMGYKVSSELYFQEYILAQTQTPIVLFISAVEDLIEHPKLAQDFFPLLRYWHEKAKWSQAWKRLRIVISHSTEIYVPLKINQSPFNIGQSLKLPRFSAAQIYELALRYGLEQINLEHAQKLVSLVGGHPYLVNVFFYHLTTQEISLEALMHKASTPSGIYSDHLRNYLIILNHEPDLAMALKQIVTTKESLELDAVTLYRLESLGLIQVKGYQAIPSCEVYRSYFQQQLDL